MDGPCRPADADPEPVQWTLAAPPPGSAASSSSFSLCTDLTGDAVGFTTREVNRYCAIPAQACSYKIGHTYWIGQRQRAKTALGAKFDIKAFHDAGLLAGAMPLEVLGRRVDDYIATTAS